MNTSLDYNIQESDHMSIVEFSNLFNKKNEVEKQLKLMKEHLQSLNDAEEELMINMDNPYLQIGECFLKVEESEMESHLESQKEEASKEIERLQQDHEAYTARIMELKAHLYAKFGSRINLEA